MSFLIDTNVISELARPRPEPRVVRWVRQAREPDLHLSVLTLGELRRGVDRLASSTHKERLHAWLETELPDWFEGRILPVDRPVADRWGRLLAEVSRSVPVIDSLLAASALAHGLRLVTRNTADYDFPGLEVVNPWKAVS